MLILAVVIGMTDGEMIRTLFGADYRGLRLMCQRKSGRVMWSSIYLEIRLMRGTHSEVGKADLGTYLREKDKPCCCIRTSYEMAGN